MQRKDVESWMFVVKKAEKIACVAANGEPGFVCDVELDVSTSTGYPYLGYKRGVNKIRFTKTESGVWKTVAR